MRLPDDVGLLLNHCWTKTLREGDTRVIGLKRGKNGAVCPVKGIEMYMAMCNLLRVKLSPGFLFRPVTKSGEIDRGKLEPMAAQARLDLYARRLKGHLSSDRFTLHGFRSGAVVSLALTGVQLNEIMGHIGWRSNKMALHYAKIKQVLNPAGAAARLADLDPSTGQSYKDWNNLKGFSPLFADD